MFHESLLYRGKLLPFLTGLRTFAHRLRAAAAGVSGPLFDTVNLGVLALLVLLLFNDAVLRGQVFAESDTTDFYYPFLAEFDRTLAQGSAPLWASQIYGGYPLYADGETGVFSPIAFLAVLFFSAFDALVWYRIVRGIVAGWGAYAFGRAIGMTRLGALVTGTVFTLGSFLVTQVHHSNVVNTAVWLPLVLYFVERAVQSSGLRRHATALGAGVALGVAALGLHIQVLLMLLLTVGLYLPFRCYWGPVGLLRAPAASQTPREWPASIRIVLGRLTLVIPGLLLAMARRLGLACRNVAVKLGWTGLSFLARTSLLAYLGIVVFGVAGCLAMVQMLPLYELSQVAVRGNNQGYAFASSYSLSPHNLVSLLFPYFFRGDDRVWWSLWSEWEISAYIGIAPLTLVLLALAVVRNRYVAFFGLLGLFGLLASLGAYAPFNLHHQLWELPGFNLMRAPGRMTLLVVFAGAVLAGLGADWLDRYVLGRTPSRAGNLFGGRMGWWFRQAGFGVFLAVMIVLPAALVWGMALGHQWVSDNRELVLKWFQEDYFRQPNIRAGMPPRQGFDGLLWSLDITNLRNMMTPVLLAGTAALLAGMAFVRGAGPLWRTALVALIAFDLLTFGTAFHPKVDREQLESPNGYVWFLQQEDRTARVWGDSGSRNARPNRPMTSQVATLGGYSSLTPLRHQHFLNQLVVGNDALLDAASVRYLVRPARFTPLPDYKGASYHPRQPLLLGGAGSSNGRGKYRLPNQRIDGVKVIAALENGLETPQGTSVLEVTLRGPGGETRTLLARAGEHIADAAIEIPELKPRAGHKPVTVAFRTELYNPAGGPYRATVSYAELSLPSTFTASRVEVRTVAPGGRIRLFGLATFRKPNGDEGQIVPEDSEDLQLVYFGEEAKVFERKTALPRAYFTASVEGAAPDRTLVERMSQGTFDPHTRTIIEDLPRETRPASPLVSAAPLESLGRSQSAVAAGPAPAVSAAQISSYTESAVEISLNAPSSGFVVLTDSYYPGWVALVDGAETPIFRANYLFRAVPVTPGYHTVRFEFRPASLAAGAQLSLSMAALVLFFFAMFALVRLHQALWRLARGLAATGYRRRAVAVAGWVRQRG